MKNFNSRNSMITMAQSAANWRNTHTQVVCTHFYSYTYINTVTTTLCEAPAQLLQKLESNIYFEGICGITLQYFDKRKYITVYYCYSINTLMVYH